jgi:hypothetical protein
VVHGEGRTHVHIRDDEDGIGQLKKKVKGIRPWWTSYTHRHWWVTPYKVCKRVFASLVFKITHELCVVWASKLLTSGLTGLGLKIRVTSWRTSGAIMKPYVNNSSWSEVMKTPALSNAPTKI